ncbi:hypothetical protein [Enterovirga rhinocerotis]|uniref:MerR-like DNA binding protein n=1 Tax=Enterovirga rhinocerotis TaxID=1339210 RepID=A0A4R7BYM1_9HYPH|nr:hypothetical protein [Enterovirga rhinocerotis]TDR89126.1 hypothetical protein EV668_3614 [Enterovirga rhinocerotis]
MATYGEVETVLAALHDMDAERQTSAFRARLKHFKRLGLPLGLTPGKGKRIDYGSDEILQLAFALELTQVGVDPAFITEAVRFYWSRIKFSFDYADALTRKEEENGDVYFVIPVAMMSKPWSKDNGMVITTVPASRLIEFLGRGVTRCVLINVSDFIRRLLRCYNDIVKGDL